MLATPLSLWGLGIPPRLSLSLWSDWFFGFVLVWLGFALALFWFGTVVLVVCCTTLSVLQKQLIWRQTSAPK